MRIIGSSPNRETKKYARKSPLQKRRLRKNGGAPSLLFGSLGDRRILARGVVPVARELSRFLSGFDHVRAPEPRDLRGAFVAASGGRTVIERGFLESVRAFVDEPEAGRVREIEGMIERGERGI